MDMAATGDKAAPYYYSELVKKELMSSSNNQSSSTTATVTTIPATVATRIEENNSSNNCSGLPSNINNPLRSPPSPLEGCSSGQIPPPASFANPLLNIEPDTRSSDSLPRSFSHSKKPTFQRGSGKQGIYQRSLSLLANGVSPLLRKKHPTPGTSLTLTRGTTISGVGGGSGVIDPTNFDVATGMTSGGVVSGANSGGLQSHSTITTTATSTSASSSSVFPSSILPNSEVISALQQQHHQQQFQLLQPQGLQQQSQTQLSLSTSTSSSTTTTAATASNNSVTSQGNVVTSSDLLNTSTVSLSRRRRKSEPIMFSLDSLTNEINKLQQRQEAMMENLNFNEFDSMMMTGEENGNISSSGVIGGVGGTVIVNTASVGLTGQHGVGSGSGVMIGGLSGSGGHLINVNNVGVHGIAAHSLVANNNNSNNQASRDPLSPNNEYGRTLQQHHHQLLLQQQQQQQHQQHQQHQQQQQQQQQQQHQQQHQQQQQQQQQQQLHQLHQQAPLYREPLYMLYDDSHRARAEENIYEEVDFMTLSSLRAQYADTLSLQSWKKKGSKKTLTGTSSSSSFTRWFSTRKKNSPTLSTEEESAYMDVKLSKKQRPPICLPEIPPSGLTQEQMKRRYIVGSIVDSENSYINSLHRLINEFKKPMEEASPPILSQNKINTIFYRVEQILQCHTIFGIALSQCVREWDEKEKIGDVFINSFSKSMVLDIYSEFINNFTNAMETARKASKSKSAFAQFLQGKATSSPDRLSFFGLMVKPVQRFPQFILLLDDLLKHTPADHSDRMSLQLALTQLESLADRLNERKRDSERHFAVKQLLKDYLSNSTTTSSNRYLLRMDSVYVLDLDSSTGLVLKTKCRKLYLLNDMLVCVSVPSNRLKFQASLQDVDVIDDVKPATDNLMANAVVRTKDSTPTSTSPQHCTIERMYCDLNNLMHDLEMMSRIKNLISALRFEYAGLSAELVEQLSRQIHNEIRRKDNQITLIDRSCFQLRIRSKNFKDTICIQMSDPEAKKDWLTDVRLAKLALDRSNNPAWDIVSENLSSSSGNINAITQQRVPLFVKSLPIFATTENSQLSCALYYKLYQGLPGYDDSGSGILWICNVNENGSQLGALATNDSEMALIHSYELCDSHVTCLELVASDLIWIGLKEGRIIIVDANSPGEWRQIAALEIPGEVSCIEQFNKYVYVGLTSGVLTVFEIDRLEEPIVLSLSQSPVTCLLPIGKDMYACSHTKIWVIHGGTIEKSYSLTPEPTVGSTDSLNDLVNNKEEPRPNLLAHCGIGLWVSLLNSSIIKLYHTETFKHLQDLNVAPNVKRVLNESHSSDIPIHVTAMLATRGLLWIGTSVGVIVTLTLPRLQGVPLVSGCLNVALHRHIGPVTILLSLTPGVSVSPIPNHSGSRGGDKSQGHSSESKADDGESIYGLYADLMKVGDYDEVRKPPSNLGSVGGNMVGGGSGPGVGGGGGNLNATRMTWDLSNMTISDDSTSESASSSAIYQDNHQRSHGSASTIPVGAQGSGHTSPKDVNNSTGNTKMLPSGISGGQSQSVVDHSQLRMAANSLYDSKRSKPSTHGSEPNMASTSSSINNQRSNNASIYDTNGSVNSMHSNPTANLKTALLMTGGNGYKRGLVDNPYSSQHAHCIIWEYKL